MSNPDLRCGDPAVQWEWHEAYRDLHKNMYRTSYGDMVHGRETHAKSDFPSGYGGHIPVLRYDIIHRNTEFDRSYHLRRSDPGHDALPSFKDQIDGIPSVCKCPRGSRKAPSYKTVPNNGTTHMIRAPWGTTMPIREPPTYRSTPASLSRSLSSPAVRSVERASRHAPTAGGVSFSAGALASLSGGGGSRGGSRPNSATSSSFERRRQFFAKTPYPEPGAFDSPADSEDYDFALTHGEESIGGHERFDA